MRRPRGRLFRALLGRPALEREMTEEMRLHIEMEADELARDAGLSPDEARRRAAASFGGVERHKEDARDGWGLRWLEELVGDLRYGARSLRRTPAFTLVAVLALGLGIGANAAVFSVVDAVAFRPLPVQEPDRIVALFGVQPNSDELLNISYPVYQDIRREVTGFTDIAAFTEGPVNLADEGQVDVAWAGHVTGNYFTMLGVHPALGRALRPEDERQNVVVLGDALWRSRFDADPGVLGRTVRINGAPFTVVGVLRPDFLGTRLFSFAPTLWTPIGMHARTMPGSDSLLVRRVGGRLTPIGRLAERVSISEASAAVNLVAARLAERYPQAHEGFGLRVISNRTPINVWLGPPERMRFISRFALLGVGLVLLIACADVANLLLARMSVRRREVAIRLSLGASRGRLVRQFLAESLLLAALGLLAAVPLAMLALRGSDAMIPPTDFATAFRPVLDLRVLGFAAAVAVLAGLAFGLAPALHASSPGIAQTLRDVGAGASGRRSRLRDALVVGQVTLSLVVLTAAGLLMRSLRNVRAMDPGFRVDGAVVFTLDPRLGGGYDRARIEVLYRTLLERLAALPGVTAVSRSTSLPLDGTGSSMTLWPEGHGTAVADAVRTEINIVSVDFFETLGARIAEGRAFAPGDTAGPEGVVINEALARRLWPDEPALGKRVRYGPGTDDVVDVIGIMRTTRIRHLGEAPRPAMVFSLLRNPVSRSVILVRSAGDPAALFPALRREVARLDADLPVIGLKTLRDHISPSYSAAESGAWGAGVFGLLALLLAASGIFGVISYAVTQRTREIAIRMAIGARHAQVIRMVLGGGLRLTMIGLILGAVLALVATRGLASMLYGVAPHDPLVIGAVVLLLAATATAATLLPAWRATRVDPMRALRIE